MALDVETSDVRFLASRRTMLAVSLAMCLKGGCATWEVPEEQVALPAPPPPSDSALLQIEFIKVPADWANRLDELWEAADEQHFAPAVRRTWSENGLRCGVLKSQLPPLVHDLLASEKSTMEQLAAGAGPEESQLFANFRELRSRPGKRYKIVAAPRIQSHVVVLITEQQRVRAAEFSEAQGMFSLRTQPVGDGRVEIELIPLIEHGSVRQRIVPGQGSFLLDAGRDNEEIPLLEIQAVISPGETLLVSSTPQVRGLGGWYFGHEDTAKNRSLMLIRLAQSQYDSLFRDETPEGALTTEL